MSAPIKASLGTSTRASLARVEALDEAARAAQTAELAARIAQFGQHFARSGWSQTTTVRLQRSARAWGWR